MGRTKEVGDKPSASGSKLKKLHSVSAKGEQLAIVTMGEKMPEGDERLTARYAEEATR